MYLIRKTIERVGKNKQHVLMTNGHSEILEIQHENIATKLVEVMNENSDDNCSYELVPVNKTKK
jgi:hypothetical protein